MKARQYVWKKVCEARRRGVLKPSPCPCGSKKRTVGHHDDYLYPLGVRYLCDKCHRRWHKKHGPGQNADIDFVCVRYKPRSRKPSRFSWKRLAQQAVGSAEAARILGVSAGTAKVWIAAGYIPARRVGRSWLIHRKDLETFKPPTRAMLPASKPAKAGRGKR
jgi:excisionase family DNA binding protein